MNSVVVDGKAVSLGERIGRGGEGEVYALADNSKHAVKLYTIADLRAREAKVAAMVKAGLASKAPLVAFPLAIARRRDGAFAGFVMPLVSGHKPLHELYSPGPRKQHFPQADYRFLVRVAANISRAVASVHQAGCAIGDINHSSMLISPKAVAALIDADSFQVSDGASKHLCRVGVPEYTPPELQGRSFDGVVRTPNHDAFGLAVVVFQILFMGRHPFVGTVRRGDIPPLHENIRAYRYVYADDRDVGMDQPPGTPDVVDFSPAIAKLFDSAFGPGSDVTGRPSAEDWIRALDELERALIVCPANSLHHFPKDASECAWCEMEDKLATTLFIPFVPAAQLVTGNFDPGAAGFNLNVIWGQIESISIPRFELKFGTTDLSPTEQAVAAANSASSNVWWRVASAIGAIASFVASTSLWILYVPMLWFAVFGREDKKVNVEPFVRRYVEVAERFEREVGAWYARVGIEEFNRLRRELEDARAAYQCLRADEQRLLDDYRRNRKAKQLYAYLDSFDVGHAQIRGIGPAKKAALASYGIDTAADVTEQKVLAVPGFGPSNSIPIIEWRRRLEGRFVYSTQENAADRQELAKIRSGIEARASNLRQKLTAGPRNLDALSRRVRQAVAVTDPALIRCHKEREQAKADLTFLNVQIPSVQRYSPPLRGPRAGQSASSSIPAPSPLSPNVPTSSGSAPSCPRCGSPMQRRLARRGRNAGGYFLGCTRYPRCKGTRN